jgi:hypothetical protein
MIMISNFDIANSEISQIFDFSGFISLCYPSLKKDSYTIKEIICKKIPNFSSYDGVIRKCIGSYSYSITNLNEFIFNTKEVLEEYIASSNKDYNLNEVTNTMKQITLAKEVEDFKSKQKLDFISKDTEEKFIDEFLNTSSLSKMNLNNNLGNSCNSNIQNNLNLNSSNFSANLNLNNNNHSSNSNNNSKTKFRPDEKIKSQISMAPIHVQRIGQNELDEEIEGASLITAINNCTSSNKLTESLSKTQKILLLSAFLATESSPKLDTITFKSVKRTKTRIRNVRIKIIFSFFLFFKI